jgi:hypothetical protein
MLRLMKRQVWSNQINSRIEAYSVAEIAPQEIGVAE